MCQVNDLINEQDDLSTYLFQHYLYPNYWEIINGLPNYPWKSIAFNENNLHLIPNEPGIYSFVINPGKVNHPQRYLGYIGKTERTLQIRYRDYLREANNPRGRPKVLRLLNKWQNYIDFCYFVYQENNIGDIEDNLISAFVPVFNSDYEARINRIINAF